MPENLDFEKAMQQQLDGFQVTPSPSDWQAVYQQLHPNKKRRPIWWWIPALLMMLAIGWYISKEPNGAGQPANTSMGKNELPQTAAEKSTAINQTTQPQTATTKANSNREENGLATIEAAKQPALAIHENENISRRELPAKSNETFTKNDAPASKQKGVNAIGIASGKNKKITNSQAAAIVAQSGTMATFDNVNTEITTSEKQEFSTYHLEPLSQAAPNKLVGQVAPLQGPIPYRSTVNNEAQTNSASRKSKPVKWPWGVYAGVGANRLT